MATIKHLSSKNSNYAAAESYLTFQHNEYTGLPILDEKGRPKLRDSYLLDTLECGESSFAMACLIANRKYGKNGGREDVKTHHYIISFDPKDVVENDLTMERSQQCREHPRPHRHRQLACPHRGTAAFHGQAVRLGSGQEAPLHLCHAPAPPCRSHGDVRASRPEPDQPAGSPRRPCFGARVLGAAARTTPPRPCQRQTCRRKAAAHPDRLPDRAPSRNFLHCSCRNTASP